MSRYAENTTVPIEKSRIEIEQIVARYGATTFAFARDDLAGMASIQFLLKGRHIKFMLTYPKQDEKRFHFTPSRNTRRSPEDAYREWKQACRQIWRALGLCIKAKMEAVEAGIVEFDDEFMAHIVVPGGMTLGEVMRPQIAEAYKDGTAVRGIRGLLCGSSNGTVVEAESK